MCCPSIPRRRSARRDEEVRLRAVRLKKLQGSLKAQLWFIPGVASVIAFAATKGFVAVDHIIGQERRAWYLFTGEAESARELLSTIASAMMAITGVVFSITILVLQLASGQFSPRVLRTFLEDRNTQTAMASFVATFVFALTLLPQVRSGSGGEAAFVPALSLFVAFVLVLVSIAVFIRYIDHMAHSIRAINVIKHLGDEARRAIDQMYPEDLLESAPGSVVAPPGPPDLIVPNEGPSGVLTAVDEDELLALAQGSDAVVALVPLPGDFVPEGAPLLKVWGSGSIDHKRVRRAVYVERERTPQQDPAFSFRELVDIGERALSPSTNDPSTAVQVLDEIHGLLRLLAQRRFPSPLRVDKGGKLRLILPRPDWEAYVRLGLDEIRQYGRGSTQVIRRMRAALQDCWRVAPPERRRILEEQLELLDEAARQAFPDPREQEVVQKPSLQGHGET